MSQDSHDHSCSDMVLLKILQNSLELATEVLFTSPKMTLCFKSKEAAAVLIQGSSFWKVKTFYELVTTRFGLLKALPRSIFTTSESQPSFLANIIQLWVKS